MRYKIAGVSSLIVYFGEKIDTQISETVLFYYQSLKSKPIPGLIEIIPSYSSLYVEFDIFIHDHASVLEMIRQIDPDSDKSSPKQNNHTIIIPTYYHEETGLDLHRVAQLHQISIDEVIEIHSKTIYRVYTIGFAPGFGYMGNVSHRIATPRLSTPRTSVPKGSVAIANEQCAVYPAESPGGWNILGRTYIEMFDKNRKGLSLLHPGDLVRFEPIDRDTFLAAGGMI